MMLYVVTGSFCSSHVVSFVASAEMSHAIRNISMITLGGV